jgi:AraC family transcriptional regulator, transcriptional activator of the genes for pyochelin and ferripyochelin receptors
LVSGVEADMNDNNAAAALMTEGMVSGEMGISKIATDLMICRSDLIFNKNGVLHEPRDPGRFVQISFCLEGAMSWRYSDPFGKEFSINRCESRIQDGISEDCFSSFYAGQHCAGLSIGLGQRRFGELISSFRSKHASAADFGKTTAISPKVRLLLNQLNGQLNESPICESLRPIYTEGKVLELLAVYFDERIGRDCGSSSKPPISKEDYERLLLAKEIIRQKYAEQLTISSLARMVCLNEFKLKTGFKQCFGHTVYGYTVCKRMEAAAMLLDSGKSKVKDVAWQVGYCNVSHFIKAFKKQYGCTPGQITATTLD